MTSYSGFVRLTRSVPAAVLVASLAACGSSATGSSSSRETVVTTDGGGATDKTTTSGAVAIGTPCVPAAEGDATFAGFYVHEVSVEQNNASCGGGTCLVDHFRGRVTCPYGQDQNGMAQAQAPACTVPGTSTPVQPNDPTFEQGVAPQCVDRAAATAVTCSCRCANPDGKTDDGASYCTCGSGMACAQLVSEIAPGDPLAGAYCIPAGAAYDPNTACASSCDPGLGNCPSPDAGALPSASGQATSHTYFTTALYLQPGNCLPQSLPVDSNGLAECAIYFVLAASDTCSAHPGLSTVTPEIAAQIEQQVGPNAGPVCVASQVAATNGACDTTQGPGWCYVGDDPAPNNCPLEILLTPSLPTTTAVSAILACQ